MQFKKRALIIYFILYISYTFGQNNNTTTNFRPPVDIPIFLAGNFGEIRSTHFHAGIDIKTQGTIGKNVYAVEDGYISRIKVSVNSYGKTLYINHPGGYTTVYGHLDKFNSKIDKLVKSIQYKNREFEINYFPERNEFPVKKGDIIGFSGNTGSSEGPHLHFEVRKTDGQIPLNPLKFNFDITDDISPVLYSLVIYPLDKYSYVNNENKKQFFNLKKQDNKYVLDDTGAVWLHGNIGFGIEMYDYLNGSRNRCGIYTLSVFVDSALIYSHSIDKFSFYETGYVRSHIDYEEKIRSRKTIQKTFLAPNNNLSIYKSILNRGIYDFNKDTTYNIRLSATDVYGNKSELVFDVESKELTDTIPHKPAHGIFMDWETENTFENEEIKIAIPAKSLFDTIYFTYSMSEPDFKAFSNIHHIHNIYTPLYKSYRLSIKTENLPSYLKNKALIAELYDDEINYIGGDVVNGHIVSEISNFGDYVVLIDSIGPEIKLSGDLNSLKNETINFTITDNLSGIKSFNGFIDNNWALFEYDKKNDLLFYTIDKERIKKGIEHELELFVIDNMDNISTFYAKFNW